MSDRSDDFRFPRPQLPASQRLAVALALAAIAFVVWRERDAGAPLLTLTDGKKPVAALAISAAGDLLATGGDDHAIRVYDLATGKLARTIAADDGTGDGVRALAFSPTGDQLVAATGRGTALFRVADGSLVKNLESPEHGTLAVAFGPRGDFVATSRPGDPLVRVYDAHTGALAHALQGHEGDVFALAFAPTGERLATGGADGTVRTWSLASGGELSKVGAHDGAVTALAWWPVGRGIASAGDDHVIKLWDTAGKIAGSLPTAGSVRSLAFAPTGERVWFGGADAIVRGFALAKGVVPWERKVDARPLAVALDPRGERLAVSFASGAVLVFEVAGAR